MFNCNLSVSAISECDTTPSDFSLPSNTCSLIVKFDITAIQEELSLAYLFCLFTVWENVIHWH